MNEDWDSQGSEFKISATYRLPYIIIRSWFSNPGLFEFQVWNKPGIEKLNSRFTLKSPLFLPISSCLYLCAQRFFHKETFLLINKLLHEIYTRLFFFHTKILLSIISRKWYFVTKIVLTYYEKKLFVIEKNFWNSRLKAENLQNVWDH